jgi:anthranilate synthase component 1
VSASGAAPLSPTQDGGFEGFAQRAAKGGLVPVWREILLDSATPVAAYAALREPPFSFLLESAPAGSETWSRWTYLGAAPRKGWRLVRGAVSEWTPDTGWGAETRPADPLAALDAWIAADPPVEVPELGDVWGGAIGYLGYDVVRYIERLPDRGKPSLDVPDALFVLPSVVIALDNLRGGARCIATVRVATDATAATLRTLYDAAVARLDAVIARLRAPSPLAPLDVDALAAPATGDSSLDRATFERHVERMLEYIRAGDVFQVLLSRRVTVPRDFDALTLYRVLRGLNPSPYQYCLELDGVSLVGSSPELLVRVADGRVTVRPIAGTRPRGLTAAQDADRAAELAADPKERAEHVMLVDLGRNDVGRIAEFGTVEVPQMMQVERYSHVLHLVSEVTGTLRPGVSAFDAFRAVFPAGTMTGAPKIRAMEIIDELEPTARGPYAGAVGWIGGNRRRMDLAITIRTCVLHGDTASISTGAGIVADSVPAHEWAETENKARAILTAIGRARSATPAGG